MAAAFSVSINVWSDGDLIPAAFNRRLVFKSFRGSSPGEFLRTELLSPKSRHILDLRGFLPSAVEDWTSADPSEEDTASPANGVSLPLFPSSSLREVDSGM